MTEERYIKVSDIVEILDSDDVTIHFKLLIVIMKTAKTIEEHELDARNEARLKAIEKLELKK